METSKIKEGTVVKFVTPINNEEENQTFTVVELRGDRVLVSLNCDMILRPTFVYEQSELTIA